MWSLPVEPRRPPHYRSIRTVMSALVSRPHAQADKHYPMESIFVHEFGHAVSKTVLFHRVSNASTASKTVPFYRASTASTASKTVPVIVI